MSRGSRSGRMVIALIAALGMAGVAAMPGHTGAVRLEATPAPAAAMPAPAASPTGTVAIGPAATPGTPASGQGTPAAGAGPASLDWAQYDNDASDARYSLAARITPGNAAGLRLAWSFHTGVSSPRLSFESTPVEAGGRLFLTAPDDEMFALDATTGRQLWHVAPQLEPNAPPQRVNRGVAYGDGRVYLTTVDDRLIAYDAATGARRWSARITPSLGVAFESAAPLFVDGRVIVGIAAGEHEIRGFVAAYAATTGKQLWRFATVPGPADPGGASWPPGDRYLHGGGPVWMTAAADPVLGLVYFCVANPSPDFNGSGRAGDNLYTDSIVAVHAASGALAWHFQEVHHDLWDYDPASSPVLLDLPGAGGTVPALIQAGKTGFLYVLDRRTGAPVVPAPEVPVPAGPPWQHASPTQPEPRNQPFSPQCPPPGLYPREGCIFTPPDEVPMLQAPGGIGGSAWSPVSYSPRTGLAYIAANSYPVLRSTTPHACCFGRSPSNLPGEPQVGGLVGYDVANGRIAWQAPVGGFAFGGSAVTAGDVLFSGESSGAFDAWDARTGRLLFRYPTAAGADAAPSVYVANGREYVAIAAGGNTAIHSKPGDTLLAFALP